MTNACFRFNYVSQTLLLKPVLTIVILILLSGMNLLFILQNGGGTLVSVCSALVGPSLMLMALKLQVIEITKAAFSSEKYEGPIFLLIVSFIMLAIISLILSVPFLNYLVSIDGTRSVSALL